MSRLAYCLILLSSTLHAGELDPLVSTEGLTFPGSTPKEHGSAPDNDLLTTVFEETEPVSTSYSESMGSICYEDYCRQCDSRTFTARVGFLHWRPDDESDEDGGFLGGSRNFDGGFGPYVDLIYHNGDADLEFIFFSVYDWKSGASLPTFFSVSREADLENYELNLKKEVFPGVRLLTGLRVVTLDTIGTINIPMAMPPVTANLSADNELIGWQFGVETVWYRRGPFSVDTAWKGGVYHNDIEAGFGVPGVGAVSVEQGDTSFLTDLWFNLNYRLTDNMALRGGYSLMYIDPVATLGVDSGGLVPGPDFDLDDDVFIHGLHMMLEVGI